MKHNLHFPVMLQIRQLLLAGHCSTSTIPMMPFMAVTP